MIQDGTPRCVWNRGEPFGWEAQRSKPEFSAARPHQTVTVNLSAASGAFLVEWFNPSTGETWKAAPVEGGGGHSFTAPFGGDTVLYLRKRETDQAEMNGTFAKFDSARRLLQPKDAAAVEQGTGRTAKNTVKT